MTTILVTGTGANIGYGAVRLFKKIPGVRVVATDIYDDAVGQHWADAFYKVPLTSDTDYVAAIKDIIAREKIDLIVPAIEQDVYFYNENRKNWDNVSLALNAQELIHLCRDKWIFQEALQATLPQMAIPSCRITTFEAVKTLLGLPFLLKPRQGYAGKGQFLIKSEADYHAASFNSDAYFAQAFIGDSPEFTVSYFGDGAGHVCAQIQMERTLSAGGATKSALVVQRADLSKAIQDLAKAFPALGPTNAQFRILEGWPVLLEINPRLSSSLSLRAAFGYDDCVMLLDQHLKGAFPTQPEITNGYGIRYEEDFIVPHRNHI